MIFWIGIVIVSLGFAVEFAPAKKRLRSHFQFLSDRHLDLFSLGIFVVGCLLAVIGNCQDQKESSVVRDDIDSIRSAVRHVKAKVEIRLIGNWKDGAGPAGIFIDPGRTPEAAILVYDSNEIGTIGLDLIGKAIFTREKDGTIVISYRAETQPDSPIVGRSVGQFEKARELHLRHTFNIPPAQTHDGKISIVSASVRISINETHHYTIDRQPAQPLSCEFGSMLALVLTRNELQAKKTRDSGVAEKVPL